MATDDKAKKKEVEDLRIDFLMNYVMKSLRLKTDKWTKMITTDEYKGVIRTFLEDSDRERLIIMQNQGMQLVSDFNFPPKPKSKFCYFIRIKIPTTLTVENMRTALMYGDLLPDLIGSLESLFDSLFLPLLNNPLNQEGWTEATKEELKTESQRLRNAITEIKGNMQNTIILPLPIEINELLKKAPEFAEGDLSGITESIKDSVETIVISWLKHMKEFLHLQESEVVFTDTKYPLPSVFYTFWEQKHKNAEFLAKQLGDKPIKTIAYILEKLNSVFISAFKTAVHDVLHALVEARDINIHLAPLIRITSKMEGMALDDLKDDIRPMLLTLGLVWGNSKYFGKTNRMVLFCILINNMLIECGMKMLEPDSLLQGDIEEASNKVQRALDVLSYHKETLNELKNRLDLFRKKDAVWSEAKDGDVESIFSRFNLFVDRLKDVKEMLKVGIEFVKLERIELSGIKGRYITTEINNILEEFNVVHREWGNITFNPIDPDPAVLLFPNAMRSYLSKTEVLERKLGHLLEYAFVDCGNLHETLELIQISGSLLECPVIKGQVLDNMFNVTTQFAEELDQVKIVFDKFVEEYKEKGLEAMDEDPFFPPVSATLSWLNKLRDRIISPYEEFPFLEFPAFENDYGENVLKKYREMLDHFAKFESEIFERWKIEVLEDIITRMDKPLLRKSVLKLNFDRELVFALHDIRSLRIMGYEIPDDIMEFYNKQEELWDARVKLQRICEWYNNIHQLTDESEFNMVKNEIDLLNNLINPALEEITWNNFEQDFIDSILKKTKDLWFRIQRSQEDLEAIRTSIRSWGNIPLYHRKDNNPKARLDIENREIIMNSRFAAAYDSKLVINRVLLVNLKLFNDIPLDEFDELPIQASQDEENLNEEQERNNLQLDEESPSFEELLQSLSKSDKLLFRAYEEYVDSIVAQELTNAILKSLQYLKAEIDNRFESNSPLLEIRMELQEPYVIYIPALETSEMDNFNMFVESLLEDISSQSEMITKIAQPYDFEAATKLPVDQEKNYKELVLTNNDILALQKDIMIAVEYALSSIISHVKIYNDYTYIWRYNKQRYLDDIKKYGIPLKQFERDTLDEKPEIVKEVSLDVYKTQLDKFIALKEEVEKWEMFRDFSIWLRLNKKGFIYSVLNQINRWIGLFKQDLIDRVVNALQEMGNFINEANDALQKDITQDDFEGLLKIMSILSKINERQYVYDEMFDPLKEVMNMLKDYNYEFPEKVHKQFSELPDEWFRLKKKAALVRNNVAQIQSYQINLIEKRIILFENRVKLFRNVFLQQKFFHVPCLNAYELFDEVNEDLIRLEEIYQHLKDSAALFEIEMREPLNLFLVRKELKWIKQLWDYVLIIQSTVDDWKKTAWTKIDVDDLDQESKKFGRKLRTLPQGVRSWQPYTYAESILKNLMTSLRAVTELQNPAIRDRHWQELMKQTQVRFAMDESTVLADLLDLNLHNYEEEVKNIVDQSTKEMAMEKTLSDLNATWNTMEFEAEVHDRTKLRVLKFSEEIMDLLEDFQGQVQGMLSSKYIGHFEKEALSWQQKLSTADQVSTSWFEVQRKWMYLESIFIGSADIRKQLPEDSRRFDSIDKEFKGLLSQMMADRHVIRSTNKPGLFDKLEDLNAKLILCEKALNDYLETKRLTYPRFYFVSSADLLDILSNGNKPLMVAKHLTKLYDSLGKLDIAPNSKSAKGMVAKVFDEYVPFVTPCDCSGAVEVWLNRVTDKMRETLREQLRKAVIAYDEKPRHIWVFEWQAQPALVTTQIWWTMETTHAFTKMDMGYENALKDYQRKQILQLNSLIDLLLGDLSPGDRQKIMTICTIDVHSRDVVGKMIALRIESASSFQWQSQLRHRWDDEDQDCFSNICDAEFRYDHEYLGNTPRLVITPLTDRCYITLTQSLHLVMGGAPAGPAGTGKTETTKDLGRTLGIMVYVFNCSEQMDYKSVGNIHKGLAQTGAWGCFDEFNRIAIEVLSVIAVQVKSIQDAIKGKRKTFNFLGEIISLRPTCGMFITMNPGYAGRTELPENLKALYRPCAMVVPDFALICEIMLVAEGFQDARLLARKFITLYTLCKELLSKQDHYDWGLRAIKSVLVVAGSLRRGDQQRPEDQVLMRALRDFNVPKIVTDDVPVFMGLIGDLFPALDVPRKRDLELEKVVKQSAIDLGLQPEDGFVLKVVQLEELFAVRHSVFIIGNAGTGKTKVWKTLHKTYVNQKRKPGYDDLNPKAVSNDELFGIVNPSTREWKDGLISIILRNQANAVGTGPKWIVLDGDIDPMWIESLNTVMDDNKVLTLASNERIALTNEMRLLFEIYTLKTATPATVSRAGILYINPQDLGWNPFVASWINTRESSSEKSTLTVLFEKYIPPLLEVFKTRLKTITPISNIAMIQMTCFLLDCFLTPQNVPPECPKTWYEIYFVFAAIWGFGSTLFQDQIIDWRTEFHKWWINEFKTVKFPAGGNLFSFYVDPETKNFLPWTNLVKGFTLDPNIPLQANLVNTGETTRIRYFIDLLVESNHPVMLIGPAGSGKTVLIQDKLNDLPDNYAVTNVPCNFYTTSELLQQILEKPLEKKAGRNYGPVGNKKMIYFVDDMNMPEVDLYGTVAPHTLIRQFMDYKHWYDRTRLTLKDIHNCQFLSSMNPTAGSFTINPRLQRHFCSFAVNIPGSDAMFRILNSILSQHLDIPENKFSAGVKEICTSVVNTAIVLHSRVSQTFLPTAIKFHYNFNLRDMANIFTGMLYANGETCPTSNSLVRLWVHEASRIYQDKLVDDVDISEFQKLLKDVVRRGIESYDEDEVFEQPLMYCHFAKGLVDPKYMPVTGWSDLQKLLIEAQSQYNDLVGAMNLVLFEDAMAHICRISRILMSSRGYALLIGVGGSGKQSLTRLAAFISSLDVFQIQLTKEYGINDLKENIAALYQKAGIRSTQSCFLMTDAEVAREEFLVVVNDLLASGDISELFPDDEVENIIGGIRNEVRQQGIFDSRENCWKFFINKVRGNLKVVLCFSPVGSTLRVRSRKFPAVVNCTTIDWFHEWPKEALESVSLMFLRNDQTLPKQLAKPISQFMAYVHETVNEISQVYLLNDKRHNYTTPKSFLELIALYTKLLSEKVAQNKDRVTRLENGLIKLASCAEEVDGLQDVLKDQEVIVKEKNDAADKLIVVVSAESEKVQKERNFVSEEEKKVKAFEEDVSERAKTLEEEYKQAQPALIAAQEALNTLNKNNLTELKSFGTPPPAVVSVCGAVMVLFSKGKIPRDRSWKACKVLMGRTDQFLNELVNYDKENIHPDIIKALQPYLKDPEFDPEKIRSKSTAAAGICAWVLNIHKFYQVYLDVEPKLRALTNAQNDLKEANKKLEDLSNRLNDLEQKLSVIQADFDNALAEKQKVKDEADKTAFTIDLATRLIKGLASEKIRWTESVKELQAGQEALPGDILLVSCFISYVGCFTRPYRIELNRKWIVQFKNLQPKVPASEQADPFDMICDDAQIAEWNNQGLPSDRMSAENGAILSHCDRYPLMIDPQLQGIKWIKQRYGKALVVTRSTVRGYMDVIERAVSNGSTLLLENIEESVDAILNPLLARSLIKKGTCLKLGDKEIDFNRKFRLILHTKLANPHYKPEMQAQTTLINFTVTRDGLEDQLLADVVKAERPDLELMRTKLTTQQNTFKITLKFLEDDLLQRLSSAGENVLEDVSLVVNLEKTKKTAEEIEEKVVEARTTAEQIDAARELYRPASIRASIIYFIMNDLFKINPMYQFSLKAFKIVFNQAIERATPAESVKERVLNLIDSITFGSFMYTSRGLFERDKLIFLTQLAVQIFLNEGEIEPTELDFLLRFPYTPNLTSPVPFLTNVSWGGIKALSNLPAFRELDKDVEGSPKRWEKLTDAECPEKEPLPGEWKTKTALQKLCIMRALRPDRMTYAVLVFIEEKLGSKYIGARMLDFSKTFEETSSNIHTFFILSPGVDPLLDVERLGKVLGFSSEQENFHSVSLGQGQEIIAENAIDVASKLGHWVILQNIHLVKRWLSALEKKIEGTMDNSHPDYRLFLSAEPPSSAAAHILPQGILDTAIKITNEPPTGMFANLHKALDNFDQETLEMCSKQTEFKSILFALCYFHAVVAERRKFGPQGWNRVYPFNVGDLTISVYVLYNYLEANTRVPWEDLRYLFGEIMYGGHITDDWDRRLCKTYLEEFMQPELIDGDISFSKGFPAPPNNDYEGYHSYIDDYLPAESPHLYGLHTNAEIGFLTTLSERLFQTVFELQPRMTGGGGGGEDASQESVIRNLVEDLIDKIPPPFNIYELMAKVENRDPYIIVAFQECERMNNLMAEVGRSMRELDLGLKGELTISSDMETLMEELFFDKVPESWTKLAYPSTLGLQSWFADLQMRLRELEGWVTDFRLPSSVWLGGFFNPQSFLTAIMQQTARKNEWPLDRMCLNCDVTKRTREEVNQPPREGAFVCNLFMEGARWDSTLGTIADAHLKELFPSMPVIYIRAITQDKQDTKNIYECPVYRIRERGPTFVWTFNLKTKEKASKWTLAGVCLLLQT